MAKPRITGESPRKPKVVTTTAKAIVEKRKRQDERISGVLVCDSKGNPKHFEMDDYSSDTPLTKKIPLKGK